MLLLVLFGILQQVRTSPIYNKLQHQSGTKECLVYVGFGGHESAWKLVAIGLVEMIPSLVNPTDDDCFWLVELIKTLINSPITTGRFDHGLDQDCDAYACKVN